jgi:exodeoxyribonuclease V gamma subunit
MSIYLNVSNSLQPLSLQLATALKETNANPFTPQWVITQTEGMNSWLKQQLAIQNGIAAHIKFSKPNDIIASLCKLCMPSGKAILTNETVRWTIYSLLGNDAFINTFPQIAAYYTNNDIKRIALTDELTDLFDQYQVYRHTTIQEWNTKIAIDGIEDWQEWLWVALRAKVVEHYQDRTDTADVLLKELKKEATRQQITNKIPSLYLFGIAVITPFYLQLYHALAQFMDIHLYLVNPSPEQWWLEDKSEKQIARLLQKKGIVKTSPANYTVGNDLLMNWGALVKESFGLLMEQDDFVNQYDTAAAMPIHNPNTLLKKIQADIYQNAAAVDRNSISAQDIDDGSITINGAYTPVREVEVLYNYIASLIDQKQVVLAPKDIVVLISDVDLYAPYIHAVFGNAPHKIPYTIADESYTSGVSLFNTLQELLSFDTNSFKAEAVLQLLDAPLIRKRFKLDEGSLLREAIRQAGIIYSKDGRVADETRTISWNYGLKKIIYGICMSGEYEVNDGLDTFIPLDTMEGNEALDAVRLVYFVKVLQRKMEVRSQDKTIAEWAMYVQELVEDMIIVAGEGEDEEYAKFIQLTEALLMLEEDATVKISFEVFRYSFLKRLQLEQKSASFMKGGITFCSMVPMRSIPFKVVAMLGMNFDKFPRKETAISFSLLQHWKPGDRNVKNNDKHLFLETLLSAQQFLYISYIAVNAKDGASLPASSLVDELIDYIARGYHADTDRFKKEWVHIHPLHSFSHQYNPDGGLLNYLTDDRYKTGVIIQSTAIHKKEFDFNRIAIDDIGKFLQNPPKLYLNKQLNVYYHEDEVLLQEHELFELDSLTTWSLQDACIYLDEALATAYYKKAKKEGKLPLHNMGKVAFSNMYNELSSLRDRFQEESMGNEMRSFDLSLHLDASIIDGRIDRVYGNKFISVCNSSQHLKYFLNDYVRYLLLVANGHHLDMVFIAKKIKENVYIAAGELSEKYAKELLSYFCDSFKQGHDAYFYFYPALGLNNLGILSDDYADFWSAYEEINDKEQDYTFSDVYLEKAIEFGFFSEANYPFLKSNTTGIFKPISERLPDLFKEIKK